VTTAQSNAVPVLIDSAGQLGTASSSRRFKKEIKPMDQTSESILGLKPVTFHYKSDNTGTPQFGLIAEEVAEVNPDLVVRDDKGDIYTVRYDAVNAMLLNEFLKEHKKVEEQGREMNKQKTTITQLESTIAEQHESFESKLAQQEKQIEALTSGLQKVSAQLAAASPSDGGIEIGKFATGRICSGRPAPEVVLNNP
jgi:predicted ribosome quality control (RQC) complex YloA/Tae2 family protein